MSERIVVIGLGYVGLPLALALSKHFTDVVGFDVDSLKVDEIKRGFDRTGELEPSELSSSTLRVTSKLDEVRDRTFFIVAVPTPVNKDTSPDFRPLVSASETVGKLIQPGAVVVYESTVFPGVTEDVCSPVIEDVSGLDRTEFKLGYSPERINPGDKVHTLDKVVKIVSGEDVETLERVAAVYEKVAPIHKAPTIRVAEAAKVIENIQRDVNIALVNELAQLFNVAGINTTDVLEAAGTKWNFAKYKPGLVGGHCVGVDPYYLMMLGDSLGKPLRLVSLARRVNEGMPRHVALRTIEALRASKRGLYAGARVAVLGCTFKEDVNDLRNSKVFDLVRSLRGLGCEVDVEDVVAAKYSALADNYHFPSVDEPCVDLFSGGVSYDAVILAVPHTKYRQHIKTYLERILAPCGVVVDLKGVVDESSVPSNATLVTI